MATGSKWMRKLPFTRRMSAVRGAGRKNGGSLPGPWSSLILRSAAIYGTGRGVHAALREGRIPRGAGAGIVSRIHVEDLAAIIEAGLYAELEGAWPVADDAPCSSTEIAAWCVRTMNLSDTLRRPFSAFPITGQEG